ncbi:MATE family efflux transporter [Acinetobacter sp. MB5]|uniref:MATE family efflux transporter n=1 Tax=Acinetobacter sp. MB5 TaxID=2069438 RepID=UPI000DCFCA9F|nr:MATE family efflux transporter [Acinetobacter sp. MB5]
MNIFKDISIPILKLALPLILIQLCQASLGLVNTLVAGKYNYHDLAGIGLGSSIWTPIFILFTGILYVLVPKVSMLKHQQDGKQIAILFQQGKNIALTLAIFGFVLIQLLAFLCPLMIADVKIAVITKNYLHFVAFAMPGLVYMTLYRFMSEGNSQLKPIMLTFMILLICDASLCFGLVNGVGFLPQLGGAGTGLATALSAYIACFVMRYFVREAVPEIQQQQESQVTYGESLQLLKQGLPIGVTLVLQILALSTLAFFASELGTRVIAAHQIVINIAMVIIMIPVAISSATTIRVASFSSTNNQQGKVLTSVTVAMMTLIYAGLMALILTIFAHQITRLFSQDVTVLSIATRLMHYVAIFLVFDAMQTVASGVLRGLQQFMQPLVVILFCYWIIIIPLSYVMGVKGWLQLSANVDVIWKVLATGICLAALFMIIQSYRRITHKEVVY